MQGGMGFSSWNKIFLFVTGKYVKSVVMQGGIQLILDACHNFFVRWMDVSSLYSNFYGEIV